MSRPPRGTSAGFTLIELLVTLTLMSVTVALVAPGLFNTLAGIEQKSVVKEVAQDLSWLRHQAFLQEYRLEVDLDDSRISAFRLGPAGERLSEPYFEKAYPLVLFPAQSFAININGIADAARLRLDMEGEQRFVEAGSW